MRSTSTRSRSYLSLFVCAAILGVALHLFARADGIQNTPTQFDNLSHVRVSAATAPGLTNCGTGSPTISGTDQAGFVTMGTNATGCTITFNKAYINQPYCVVTWVATPLASQSYVTSTVNISTTQTSTSGNSLQYVCFARSGG